MPSPTSADRRPFPHIRARSDRERRQREHEEEARERIATTARDEFVPKGWVSGGAFLGVNAVILAVLSWLDGKKETKR